MKIKISAENLKNTNYKLSDPNIKTFVSKDEVSQAFVWILIDSYKDSK